MKNGAIIIGTILAVLTIVALAASALASEAAETAAPAMDAEQVSFLSGLYKDLGPVGFACVVFATIVLALIGAKYGVRFVRSRAAGLFVCALAFATLTACPSPQKSFVDSERATFNLIAPIYRGYVDGDPNLSDEQRADRNRDVDLWDTSIRAAERNAK